MGMTKEDLQHSGRIAAQLHMEGKKYKTASKRGASSSWRAVAFWGAFDEEIERLKASAEASQQLDGESQTEEPAKPSEAISDNYVYKDTRLWPRAAAEHFKLLKADLYKEKSPGRKARLKAALQRLALRHGKLVKKLEAFPISATPHPDGDISLGMLLRGE